MGKEKTYEELCEEQQWAQDWGLPGPFNHGWEEEPIQYIHGDPLQGEEKTG